MTAFLLAAPCLLSARARAEAPPARQSAMLHAESPRYELIAPCQKEFCQQILAFFEFARLLFERNLLLTPPARKILVSVVASEQHWAAHTETSRSAGFYIGLPSRDAILLKSFER